MSIDKQLQRLIEAERNLEVPFQAQQGNWLRLSSALQKGATGLAVATGPLKVASLGALSKAAILVAVVGGSGTAVVVSRSTADPPQASASTTQVRTAPTTRPFTVNPLPASVLSVAATAGTSPPVSPAVSPAVGRARPGNSASVIAASTLEQELALLSGAKRDLDRGNPQLARVWLDEHRRRFPGGAMAAEREGLAVIIGCSSGLGESEQASARRFIQQNPQSPILDRIQRVCGLKTQP